jgi:hypothetical protein
MRLMLGTKDQPSLLIELEQEMSPTHFNFWVVNGAWRGVFTNGYITILGCPGGDYSSLEKTEVLCDNPDRLRGDYDTVFENFNNVDYVAPVLKRVVFDDMDDDIPF